MCTLVILREENKIVATMNRDDLKIRTESPLEEIPYNIVAPKDQISQGTWIALNKNNVAAFLLNRYDDYVPENKMSRGNIVLRILINGNFAACKEFLDKRLITVNYLPFTVVIAAKEGFLKCDWDGKNFEIKEFDVTDNFVLTSSSMKEEEVKDYRYKNFDLWLKNKDFYKDLPTYNFFQEEGKKDYGVFVDREDVHTLSITQIVLEGGESDINYFDRREIEKLHGKIISTN